MQTNTLLFNFYSIVFFFTMLGFSSYKNFYSNGNTVNSCIASQFSYNRWERTKNLIVHEKLIMNLFCFRNLIYRLMFFDHGNSPSTLSSWAHYAPVFSWWIDYLIVHNFLFFKSWVSCRCYCEYSESTWSFVCTFFGEQRQGEQKKLLSF